MALIYDYIDYRAFLRDLVEERKKENSRFSLRLFASRIDCDPGLFNKIVRGLRNLSADYAIRIAQFCKFTKREQEFFEALVQFNQAGSQLERDHLFTRLAGLKSASVKTVSPQQYELYTHWFYVVLREALNFSACRDGSEEDVRALSRMLRPTVKSADIVKALETLKALGVVSADGNGVLRPHEAFISSGTDLPPVLANRMVVEFMELARQALDGIPREERSLSTLTISASLQSFDKIKSVISEARREILSIVEKETGEIDRVYHVNLQLFPVAQKNAGGKNHAPNNTF
jgi:uncharacterized protein (TIGR02147 family)